MKRLILLAAAALAACAPGKNLRQPPSAALAPAAGGAPAYGGPKRRIGVAEFEDKSAYGQARLGPAASDILVTELAKSGRFIVVERGRIDKVLEEQKLQAQGVTDQRTAAQLGQIMGLEAMVMGSVSQFGVKEGGTDFIVAQSKSQTAEAAVDIRLVDVQSAQVILADTGKGQAKSGKASFLGMGTKGGYDETLEGEALRAAITQFVANISAQMDARPWSCAVAKAGGDTLYLNAGHDSGVKPGMKLACYRLGEEILDPATKAVIGRTEEALGTVEVLGPCGSAGDCSRAAPLSPAARALKAGDFCRLAD